MSSLKFNVESSRSHIDGLVTQLNHIEESLDSVARDIDTHADIQAAGKNNLSLKYSNLIELEKTFAAEWNSIFETLLNYAPKTHKETSDVMVALVDLQLKGHNSEQIMKALKRIALNLKRHD